MGRLMSSLLPVTKQLSLDNRLALCTTIFFFFFFCRSNELGSSSMRIILTIRCYLCTWHESWKQSHWDIRGYKKLSWARKWLTTLADTELWHPLKLQVFVWIIYPPPLLTLNPSLQRDFHFFFFIITCWALTILTSNANKSSRDDSV